MFIHEYGDPGLPVIVLLHPMEVTGTDLYRLISPYLTGKYRVFSPDQGGHGQSGPYTDCKQEAAELEQALLKRGCTDVALLYGASMGVGVAYELVKSGKIRFEKMWFDGGSLTPNGGFMNLMMRTMFLKKHRALAKDPSAPVTNLVKMYGADFAAMMKANFLKLSERDIVRICDACTHRALVALPQKVCENLRFEYGSGDPNLKAAKKVIAQYFPGSALVVREGYGHCSYMAFHTEEYVREMEAFLNGR